MKRLGMMLAVLCILCGCQKRDVGIDRCLQLRQQLLGGQGCSFHAVITADYGDKLHTFAMDCTSDEQGNLEFAVTEPASIAGITGTISEAGGKLTFNDAAVAFELLADGQLSPIGAPWVFLRALRGGYINSWSMEDDVLKLSLDDSYEDDALRLDIWADDDNIPTRAEILFAGRRILTLQVDNFTIV